MTLYSQMIIGEKDKICCDCLGHDCGQAISSCSDLSDGLLLPERGLRTAFTMEVRSV